MAKKIKPVFDDSEVVAATPAATTSVVEETRPTEADCAEPMDEAPRFGLKTMSKEVAEKLEKYDALVQSNASLVAENSDLSDKIAGYIAEIESLKSQTKDVGDVATLRLQLNDLRAASDKYLVRISELSFDNARLNAQIRELQKRLTDGATTTTPAVSAPTTEEKPVQAQPANSAPVIAVKHTHKPGVYRPYANNGYSSWS